MKFACFDIEAVPSQTLSDEMKSEFAETIKTGNLKDQAKIDDKINKKMSTDKDLCQITTFVGYICTSSIAKERIIAKRILQWPPLDEEYEVVSGAWDFIKNAYNDKIPLVSFGGNGFDLPVLFAAAMRLDISISRAMYENITYRYENKHHYDLMRSLTGEIHPVRGKSLEFYLNLFHLGNKTAGMDGSQVYPAWQAKEYTKISEYCEQDVLMTAKLFERVEPWIAKEIVTDDGEIGEDVKQALEEEPWIDATAPETNIK